MTGRRSCAVAWAASALALGLVVLDEAPGCRASIEASARRDAAPDAAIARSERLLLAYFESRDPWHLDRALYAIASVQDAGGRRRHAVLDVLARTLGTIDAALDPAWDPACPRDGGALEAAAHARAQDELRKLDQQCARLLAEHIAEHYVAPEDQAELRRRVEPLLAAHGELARSLVR